MPLDFLDLFAEELLLENMIGSDLGRVCGGSAQEKWKYCNLGMAWFTSSVLDIPLLFVPTTVPGSGPQGRRCLG